MGPLVARALQREFVDLDAEIERREGRSIGAIFAEQGEPAFRALERSLTAELLAPAGSPVVLAPGGGWVEDALNREWLGRGAVAVYIRVSPAIAMARMGPAAATRPLLAGGDAVQKLAAILARRETLYMQSQYTVSAEMMTPDEVTSSIVALASIEFAD